MNELKVTIELKEKNFSLPGNTTLKKAFKILNLKSGSYLATCKGELITEDVMLQPDDLIKLIKIISGG